MLRTDTAWNPLSGNHEEETDQCLRQQRQWSTDSITHIICDARLNVHVPQLWYQKGLRLEEKVLWAYFSVV